MADAYSEVENRCGRTCRYPAPDDPHGGKHERHSHGHRIQQSRLLREIRQASHGNDSHEITHSSARFQTLIRENLKQAT